MAELFFDNVSRLSGQTAAVFRDGCRSRGRCRREDGKPALLFSKAVRRRSSALGAILADENNPNDCATNPPRRHTLPDAVR